MNHLRTLSIVPLYLIVFFSHSFGMIGRDSLVLKNNRIISTTIQSINPWAVTLIDDSVIAIKSLSEIKTSDLSIVRQIKTYYPDIIVSEKDLFFTISVATLSLLPEKNQLIILSTGISVF